jgi:hypothetical protein
VFCFDLFDFFKIIFFQVVFGIPFEAVGIMELNQVLANGTFYQHLLTLGFPSTFSVSLIQLATIESPAAFALGRFAPFAFTSLDQLSFDRVEIHRSLVKLLSEQLAAANGSNSASESSHSSTLQHCSTMELELSAEISRIGDSMLPIQEEYAEESVKLRSAFVATIDQRIFVLRNELQARNILRDAVQEELQQLQVCISFSRFHLHHILFSSVLVFFLPSTF